MIALRRPLYRQHVIALAAAVAFVVGISAFVALDRAPPFEYVNTTITPDPVVAGHKATVTRHVIWHRDCEIEVWREVVRPDGIISYYSQSARWPNRLGSQIAESEFTVEATSKAGTAKYRGQAVARSCGLTSRFWPIVVPFQEVTFEVAAAPLVPVIPAR